MRRKGDLFERVTDIQNIRSAIVNAAKGVKKTPYIRKILLNTGENAEYVKTILENGTYRVSGYKERVVMEPKRRVIHILPFFPDRIVQHAFIDVIGPDVFEKGFIFDSYACRKGKGPHRGVLKAAYFARSSKYDLRYDIKGFYHNLDHEILIGRIRRKIKDERVVRVFEDIIESYRDKDTGSGCPIGNLTSQWFGNVYMDALDHFVKDMLRVRKYIRYCDDFHIFGDSRVRLEEIDKRITEFVTCKLNLKFSKRMLTETKQGVPFLGAIIFPDRVVMRRNTRDRIRRRIFGIGDVLDRDGERLRIDRLFSMRGSVSSAIGTIKHLCSGDLAKKINLFSTSNKIDSLISNYECGILTLNL